MQEEWNSREGDSRRPHTRNKTRWQPVRHQQSAKPLLVLPQSKDNPRTEQEQGKVGGVKSLQ